MLAEYPEVGDELKAVARNRASIANKGKQEETANEGETSSHETSSSSATESTPLEPLAAAPTLIATPPPLCKDARYLALVEKEIDRIVSSLTMKFKNDMGITQHQQGAT